MMDDQNINPPVGGQVPTAGVPAQPEPQPEASTPPAAPVDDSVQINPEPSAPITPPPAPAAPEPSQPVENSDQE